MRVLKSMNCWMITFLFLALNGLNTLKAETKDTITKKNNFVYSVYYQSGSVQSSNPFLKKLNATDEELGEFRTVSFSVLKQTTGKKLWEQYYNYPRYGVGINVSRFFNNNYLSTPIAIHGAYEAPIKRWNKLSLNYEAAFGMTLNWESFNKAEKNYNISIGAAVTSYINAGLFLSYEISPHFDLGFGYGFTHYSNGAMKIPNFGLNTLAPKISLEYVINRFDPPKTKLFIPPYIKNTTIEFSFYGGEKNVIYPEINLDTATSFNGIYYPVFGLNAVLYRQINYKSKIGLGLSVGYDGSKNAVVSLKNGNPYPDQSLRKENVLLSIYPSYELVFDKISLYVQPSFYLIKNQTTYQRPTFFTRVGVKYRLWDNLYTGIGLHSYNVHKADFLEWTVGYQIPVSKK
ncbi:MAG TPA: acyloxyacyl hydrolase [Bacteroidales bacterium]